jgi:glycine/D-amino acid oxidase-like deaminating enzyme/nitrite reductase/ring-hydroxylating ferredoxin subunit
MARRLESTEPIWAPEVPALPALSGDARADVCVVGAGIAGLTTAYLLALLGRSVIVLEQDGIGAGETGRTTAHLTSVLDERYAALRKLHGDENTRLAAASHVAALKLVESVVQAESLDCDFHRVDGYLVGETSSEARRELEDELEACRALGLRAELLPAPPLPFGTGPALRFPDQAQLHPLRYLSGLARALRGRGSSIVRAQVTEVGGDEDEALVRTDRGQVVRAKALVIATHSPVHQAFGVHLKQAPYRTYAIGLRAARGSLPPGLYWDTHDPYHYLRTVEGAEGADDVLIVGGEDHKAGQDDAADERFARLESWVRDRVPRLLEARSRWSGQILEPADGLAFIGRSHGASNVYLATGFSGNGMTYGTLAGRLLADLIAKGGSEWSELYDPSRVRLRAAGRYLKEGLTAAASYGERATPGEVSGIEEIPLGEGAVIRRGLSKVATYRDEEGLAHEVSAQCTHQGCIVHWNPAEKSWDCPCHGSRFAPDGTVLNGPALRALDPVLSSVQKA